MTTTENTPQRGPGRPSIGEPINVRLGDSLPRVDEWAARHTVTRAEALRRLVDLGLMMDDPDYPDTTS